MSKAIIYSGYLRTWNKVKENHEACIWKDDDKLYFYTDLSPDTDRNLKHFKFHKNLTKFDQELTKNQAPETNVLNALNQFQNRKRAFRKATNYKDKSDIYVINRTDIVFSSPIDFNIQPNTVYIPIGNDFRDGINDQFAYGDYETMKYYCELYDYYEEYFKQGIMFHPEHMLLYHLSRKVQIVRILQTQSIVRN